MTGLAYNVVGKKNLQNINKWDLKQVTKIAEHNGFVTLKYEWLNDVELGIVVHCTTLAILKVSKTHTAYLHKSGHEMTN